MVSNSHSFIDEKNFVVFIHSSDDGHYGCFQFVMAANKVCFHLSPTNTEKGKSWLRSVHGSLLNILSICHSKWLHSPVAWTRVPVSPCPCQHVIVSVFVAISGRHCGNMCQIWLGIEPINIINRTVPCSPQAVTSARRLSTKMFIENLLCAPGLGHATANNTDTVPALRELVSTLAWIGFSRSRA